MKDDLRIVFMGTPEFAVESLRALVDGGYNVVGVITMPDKPAGRGYKLQASAVKIYAESVGLRLLQPERLKEQTFLDELADLKADLQVVVAFRMLPEVVWAMPRLGTFNLHASLLPDYRGAAPINWAVMNGDSYTGVSTFFLTHQIDMGAVIRQRQIKIAEEDNVGVVYDRLKFAGATLLTETVDLIQAGRVEAIDQEKMSGSKCRPAPKIYKEVCQLDFLSKEVVALHNQVRGLSPYPGAWFEVQSDRLPAFNTTVKVYETHFVHRLTDNPVGSLFVQDKHLFVRAQDGLLQLLLLQPAGKRRMSAQEWLNGVQLPEDAKTIFLNL